MDKSPKLNINPEKMGVLGMLALPVGYLASLTNYPSQPNYGLLIGSLAAMATAGFYVGTIAGFLYDPALDKICKMSEGLAESRKAYWS